MMHVPGESGPSPGAVKTGGAAQRSFGRAANWTVGAAAAVLVLISMAGYFYHSEELSAIAADHMRLVVTGPSIVRAGVATKYMVSTTSIGGQPIPAEIEMEITSPNGKRLKAHQEPVDDRGRLEVVVPGDLSLPSHVTLKVAARYHGSRVDAELPILIEPVRNRVQVTTDRELYRPGDAVFYRAVALDPFTLVAARKVSVHFEILGPDGLALPNSQHDAVTERGVADGKFLLPATLKAGRYSLVARSPDKLFSTRRQPFFIAMESHSSELPKDVAEVKQVQVTFYPEGGELVAGVENRVYFIARDFLGKPTPLSGKIVVADPNKPGHDLEVSAVETIRDGLGVFSLLPRAGQTYRLKISGPLQQKDEPALPKASTERNVVLSTGSSVFPAARPLEFNIRAAETGRPLVAVAYCRGVQVGQQPLITKVSSSGANPVAIDLDEAVAGVIRLVVYDYGVSPPKPVAERLVYRLPMQKLKVRVDGLNAKYKPGELAKMSLMVTDESDRPVAAAMSVAVVDPAVSGSPSSCLTPLPVYFLLTGEIEIPKGFCIADFKVSETTKDIGPAAALDLLLGVQTPSMAAPAPPLMFDNLARIRSNYEKSLMEYQADRVPALDTLTTVGFFGGLGLVLLVAMLGLMGIVSGIHLWIAAIGATTCCLIIGAILTDPGRLAMGQEATVSFSPFSDLEKRPAQDDTDHLLEPTLNPDPSLKMGEKSTIAGTAYWNPLLIAGSDGKAAIQFPLPKTAAKFRLSIQAHDAGRLGQGQAEIVSENTP